MFYCDLTHLTLYSPITMEPKDRRECLKLAIALIQKEIEENIKNSSYSPPSRIPPGIKTSEWELKQQLQKEDEITEELPVWNLKT